MVQLRKQRKLVKGEEENGKTWYDLSIIIDKDGMAQLIDNSQTDFHDLVDGNTETVIPIVVKI